MVFTIDDSDNDGDSNGGGAMVMVLWCLCCGAGYGRIVRVVASGGSSDGSVGSGDM